MRSFLLGKNPFRWLKRTLRTKGPGRALKLMWHASLDATWDFFHGTETLARIATRNLETDSENKAQATTYGATRARPFMLLLKALRLPKTAGFVDLGSGKGRVLLIAAQYGFQRIVGVDFSAPLCEIARANVEAFRRRRAVDSDIRIIHSDVVEYQIQPDDAVFFLYDPFSAEVLARVLHNMRASVEAHPRDVWVIYNSPVYHDLMEGCGLFTRSRQLEFGGTEFCVYANTRLPGSDE